MARRCVNALFRPYAYRFIDFICATVLLVVSISGGLTFVGHSRVRDDRWLFLAGVAYAAQTIWWIHSLYIMANDVGITAVEQLLKDRSFTNSADGAVMVEMTRRVEEWFGKDGTSEDRLINRESWNTVSWNTLMMVLCGWNIAMVGIAWKEEYSTNSADCDERAEMVRNISALFALSLLSCIGYWSRPIYSVTDNIYKAFERYIVNKTIVTMRKNSNSGGMAQGGFRGGKRMPPGV